MSQTKVPKYCHHKRSNKDTVNLSGHRIYMGGYDEPGTT